MTTKTDRIRLLNDELRRMAGSGLIVITPGVAALGPAFVKRVAHAIAVFDDFHHANDPHQEHDFGAFEIDGHQLFFKIDYYDPTMTCHSEDPADPSVTKRVITMMLADEY